jgi:hypothetical protein
MISIRRFGVLLPLLALVGCGPSFVVLRQAAPNPFLGKPAFALEPVRYDGLTVGDKPEQAYLAEKDAKTQEGFQGDKVGMNEKFAERLTARPGAIQLGAQGGWIIRPVIYKVEPGSFNGFVNIPTTVRMHLQLVDSAGQVLDEVDLHGTVGADIYHPSAGQRMRDATMQIADQASRYINFRVNGQ